MAITYHRSIKILLLLSLLLAYTGVQDPRFLLHQLQLTSIANALCPIDVPEAAASEKAAATTYYVSLSGSNANPGTEAQPFRTIQEAIAKAAPGDTIIVKPGTYGPAYAEATNGHAEWNADRQDGRGGLSGTADAKITLKAQNPATEVLPNQRTILVGNGSGFGFYLGGFNYIVIDGFEITNFEAGIGLRSNSSHLVLRRNILSSNTGAGIECASCSNNLFECNALLDPGPPFPDRTNAVQDYGISFYEDSANNNVVHNYFFGKHNQALSWKRRAGPSYAAFNTFEGFMYTAVYLGQNDDETGQDMTSFDITLEYNVFRDAVDKDTEAYYRSRTPITIRNVQNATIRYNYIENMLGAAVEVLPCEPGFCGTVVGRRPVGARIYGNTIVNGRVEDPHTGMPGDPPGAEIIGRGYNGDTIEIYNNTIYNTNLAFRIQGTPGHVIRRESPNPPNLLIKNNNLINVGEGAGGNLSTTTFGYNNWYDLNDPNLDNRQAATDTHLAPQMVGPLSVFDPFAVKGPNLIYQPDFSLNQGYRLSAGSPLIDAGTNLGFPFEGNAPDIGSNEFIPTAGGVPPSTATSTTMPPTTLTTMPPGSSTPPLTPGATITCTPTPIYKVYLPVIVDLIH